MGKKLAPSRLPALAGGRGHGRQPLGHREEGLHGQEAPRRPRTPVATRGTGALGVPGPRGGVTERAYNHSKAEARPGEAGRTQPKEPNAAPRHRSRHRRRTRGLPARRCARRSRPSTAPSRRPGSPARSPPGPTAPSGSRIAGGLGGKEFGRIAAGRHDHGVRHPRRSGRDRPDRRGRATTVWLGINGGVIKVDPANPNAGMAAAAAARSTVPPEDMATDRDGNLWVVDTDGLVKVTPAPALPPSTTSSVARCRRPRDRPGRRRPHVVGRLRRQRHPGHHHRRRRRPRPPT